ncbi:MAG: sialate O-acetylesterase [Acidobacteriota bacterium]
MTHRPLILLALSLILSSAAAAQFAHFITAKDGRLLDGSEEFRFVSYNIPNLHYVEYNFQFAEPNPWRLPDAFEIRDALMSIKIMGGNATRMYVLSVRKEGEEPSIPRHIDAPGRYNEEAFRALDTVLAIANETGVRVIIPFVDNWQWWGGPKEYAAFRGKSRSAFWSDPEVVEDMKAAITHLINRTNTVTGVRYKDDKAILCWETGNEIETPTYEWTRQIAAHIKSLDTNHLVCEGTFRRTISSEALADPNIDVLSTHNYGRAAEIIPQIAEAAETAAGKKPLFIGEFGFIPVEEMQAVIDTVIARGLSGIMVWSLRPHNRDGGFYYHTNDYRIPGFESGRAWQEQAVVSLLREKAWQIRNMPVASLPIPAPPLMLPVETPFAISWRGSTGASSYIIERRDASGGAWKTIADSASDAEIGYRPLYSDTSAEVGHQYFYRISARNESGVSAPSAAAGPVRVDHLVFVDEFMNDAHLYGRMGRLTYLHASALSQAKQDKHRLAGAQGDYIVYKMPHVMRSIALDMFYTKAPGKEIRILTGPTLEAMKPLKVRSQSFRNLANEYQAYLPVRYRAEAIPAADRFIRIELADGAELARLEVEQKHGTFTLAPLIAENMVLQQNAAVPVWGTGVAGATIDIAGSWGKKASVTVGDDGRWMAHLRTPSAGGPFTLTFSEYDTTAVVKNVLAGEVWLASGQSNMEMPLEGWPPSDTVANSASEIARSRNDAIRMFTVSHALSLDPESTAAGRWSASSPEASGRFSATAYFFARMLFDSLHVPIGIIHASWGGTKIEPWISAETMSSFDEYRPVIRRLEAGAKDRQRYAEWIRSFPSIDMSERTGKDRWKGLDFNDTACADSGYDDRAWPEMMLPQNWERTGMGYFDGVLWFRKTVEIPEDWVHSPLTLELGPVDDMDITFVNGTRVGATEEDGMWNAPRSYTVPAEVVGSRRISIAVRVIDNQGGGGLFGTPEEMVLRRGAGEAFPIAGAWKYLPVAQYDGTRFAVFGEKGEPYQSRPAAGDALTNETPAAIYNGMIAPLVPYAVKGAIWYQGESNVGAHEMYRRLLPALIADWRLKFANEALPFYYVQIAPYAYGTGSHSELLRDAQREVLSRTNNTGMAVTLDIGSARTIHPAFKQEVGARLARLALAKTYRKQVPYSGPLYTSMRKERGALVLSFDHAEKGLVLKGYDASSAFEIAGADRRFVPGEARVSGSALIVSSPRVKDPAAVRYAFTDTSAAALFNMEGLPASSFRTDDWKPAELSMP